MSEQTAQAPLAPPAPAADEIIAIVQEGKRALEGGDLETALARFEAVIRRFPHSREGHNNLGALYAALGRHDRAEACFSRVLELAPGTANVHYNRGISRIRLRRHDDAIADFQAVIRTSPTDADSWNNLGVAHFLKGDHAAAAANFRQALALTPNYPNAALNLADAELASGRAKGPSAIESKPVSGPSDWNRRVLLFRRAPMWNCWVHPFSWSIRANSWSMADLNPAISAGGMIWRMRAARISMPWS